MKYSTITPFDPVIKDVLLGKKNHTPDVIVNLSENNTTHLLDQFINKITARSISYMRAFFLILSHDSELRAQLSEDFDKQIADEHAFLIRKINAIKKAKEGKELIKNYYTRLKNILAHCGLKNPSDELDRAENIINWNKHRQTLITPSKGNSNKGNYYFIQLDTPILNSLTVDQCHEYKTGIDNLTSWAAELKTWEKNYWTDFFKDIPAEQINSVIKTIPSTIRAYPGLANYANHAFLTFDHSLKEIANFTRARASILIPYKLSDTQTQENLARQCISQLLNHHYPVYSKETVEKIVTAKIENINNPHVPDEIIIPVLIQSLLTEIMDPVDTLTYFLSGNETKLTELKRKIVSELTASFSELKDLENSGKVSIKFQFINTNYPINLNAGVFANSLNQEAVKNLLKCVVNSLGHWYNFCANQTTTVELTKIIHAIQCREKIVISEESNTKIKFTDDDINDRFQLFIAIVNEYIALQNFLQSGKHISFKHENIYLFVASLEELIVCALDGIAFSTCRSSKDRRALELMYEDAILSCFYLYDSIPSFFDDSKMRNLFENHFVDLFVSRHHDLLAGHNASGCDALKSLEDILPTNILDKIEVRMPGLLSFHHACSSMNRLADNPIQMFKKSIASFFKFSQRNNHPVDYDKIADKNNSSDSPPQRLQPSIKKTFDLKIPSIKL